ncbi:MAG: Nramp family divalent metal transporter [Nitrososphaerota archaeon]|nr:Nramp family divalent metal transporter [Nitrososphaerota archaeon]
MSTEGPKALDPASPSLEKGVPRAVPPVSMSGIGTVRRSVTDYIRWLGPALIVSVAYMDPGNYGTDLAAGATFQYQMLWAGWLASAMAMLLQYLSGKLGIATGKSLPELVRESLVKKRFVIPYWLAAEAAAAATDLAEYLGTVIALNLLFGVPMIYAAIFGALDVILLLTMMTRRFRLIEQYFMLLVSILVLGVLYQVAVVRPDLGKLAYGSMVPNLTPSTFGTQTYDPLLLAVGMIGATVMPHAIFVHSWLTKNKVKSGTTEEKAEKRRLHLTETVTLLTVAGVVNAGLLLVAVPFYPNPGITIQSAYQGFTTTYGPAIAVVFVVAMLASGLSSSTTGTIAGQVIMEGLIGKHGSIWLRRIVTRFINVFPTTIAILLKINPLNLLVYSQVILSLMLPLPMIPLVYYTSKKRFMGAMTNTRATVVLAVVTAVVILGFNVFLLTTIL